MNWEFTKKTQARKFDSNSTTDRMIRNVMKRLRSGEVIFNRFEPHLFSATNRFARYSYHIGDKDEEYVLIEGVRFWDSNNEVTYRPFLKCMEDISWSISRSKQYGIKAISDEDRLIGDLCWDRKLDSNRTPFERQSNFIMIDDTYYMSIDRRYNYGSYVKVPLRDIAVLLNYPSIIYDPIYAPLMESQRDSNVLVKYNKTLEDQKGVIVNKMKKTPITKDGYKYINCNTDVRIGSDNKKRIKSILVARNVDGQRFHASILSTTITHHLPVKKDGSVAEKSIMLQSFRVQRTIVNLEKGTIYQTAKQDKTTIIRNVTTKDFFIREFCSAKFGETHLKEMVYMKRLDQDYYVQPDYSLNHLTRMPNVTKKFWDCVSPFDCINKIPVNVSGDGAAFKILGIPSNLVRTSTFGFVAELMQANTKHRKRITIDEARIISDRYNKVRNMDWDPHQSEDRLADKHVSRHIANLLKALIVNGWDIRRIVNEIRIDAQCIHDTSYAARQITKKQLNAIIRQAHSMDEVERAIRRINPMLHSSHKFDPEDNIVFEYGKDMHAYSKTIGDYTFYPAVDIQELYNIGRFLNFCVYNQSSYRTDLMKRRIDLIMVKDKCGDYVNCMEINREGKRVDQAKCFEDRRPKGSLLLAILDYSKSLGLNVKHCYDLGSGDRIQCLAEQRARHAAGLDDIIVEGGRARRFELDDPFVDIDFPLPMHAQDVVPALNNLRNPFDNECWDAAEPDLEYCF